MSLFVLQFKIKLPHPKFVHLSHIYTNTREYLCMFILRNQIFSSRCFNLEEGILIVLNYSTKSLFDDEIFQCSLLICLMHNQSANVRVNSCFKAAPYVCKHSV